MPLLVFLFVAWLIKNWAIEVTCAVKGTENPRIEARKAAAASRASSSHSGYAAVDYMRDQWSDFLQERTDARRRKAAKDQADRERFERRSRRVDPIDFDERPASEPVEGAVDEAAERQRQRKREVDDDTRIGLLPVSEDTPDRPQPVDGAKPEPEPAYEAVDGPVDDRPTAPVIPIFRIVPKESSVPEATEVTGLTGAIAYAASLESEAMRHNPPGNEGYIGKLVAAKVTGAGLSTARDMQAAQENARYAAEVHKVELQRQWVIQENYRTNPDAGDKDFQLNGN